MSTTSWLSDILSKQPRVEYPWSESDPDDVMPGDIVVVGDMDLSKPNRMVLVLDSYTDRRCFLGALVTNELSLATANSLILEPEETDLPYKIAVLAGLARYMWFVQVDKRLGVITEEILDAVVATCVGVENEFQTSRRGVPLQYPSWDLRWPDLEKESQVLRELSQDCTERRENDNIALPYIDPPLLVDASKHEFLLDNYDFLEAQTRGFSPSCVRETINTLDRDFLRAYPILLSPLDRPTDLLIKCGANENQIKWLRKYTIADGLQIAPFVKIAVLNPIKNKRFRNGGKRAEVLYEPIGGR